MQIVPTASWPRSGRRHQLSQQWNISTIGRRTSKEYGIPRCLPYLTGFVIHTEIVDNSMAG